MFLRDILVIVTELWILSDRSEEAEDVINLENKPLGIAWHKELKLSFKYDFIIS